MKTKEYVRRVPATWWMHNRHVVLFMIREMSSFFVAGYAIFLLFMLYRLGSGREAFHAFFEDVLGSPLAIALQLVALVMVLVHAVTSFNAAPTIMVVWKGDEKVDPRLISGANYGMWVAASVIVLVLVFWFTSGAGE